MGELARSESKERVHTEKQLSRYMSICGNETELEIFRKNVLQLKLSEVLNAYHMGQRANRRISATESFIDWLQNYANDYGAKYDAGRPHFRKVCDSICKLGCDMAYWTIDELTAMIEEDPVVLDRCEFDFPLLHALLQDNYPIDIDFAKMEYRRLTGSEFPQLSSGK